MKAALKRTKFKSAFKPRSFGRTEIEDGRNFREANGAFPSPSCNKSFLRRASRVDDLAAGLRGLVAGGGFDGFFQVAADAGFGNVGADAGLCGVAG